MNEQTEKLIRELAEKLGTTTEKLWACLVKQASITATCELAALLAFGLLAVGLLVVSWYKHNHKDYNEVIFLALAIVAGIGFIIAVVAMSPEIAAGFLNPEYWALKQILPK